jgi:hypothetical protein
MHLRCRWQSPGKSARTAHCRPAAFWRATADMSVARPRRCTPRERDNLRPLRSADRRPAVDPAVMAARVSADLARVPAGRGGCRRRTRMDDLVAPGPGQPAARCYKGCVIRFDGVLGRVAELRPRRQSRPWSWGGLGGGQSLFVLVVVLADAQASSRSRRAGPGGPGGTARQVWAVSPASGRSATRYRGIRLAAAV